MGGKSKSSSSSNQSTETQNLNIQGSNAPVVAGEGNTQSVTNITTDQGAVDAAFEAIDNATEQTQRTLQVLNADVLRFAADSQGASLDVVDNLNADTQSTLRTLNADVLRFAADAGGDALAFAQDAQRSAFELATGAVKTEVAQSFDKLIKYSAGAASLIAVAAVIGSAARNH